MRRFKDDRWKDMIMEVNVYRGECFEGGDLVLSIMSWCSGLT